MSISLKRGAFIQYLRRLPPNKPFIPLKRTVCPIEWFTYAMGEEYDVNRNKMTSLLTNKSCDTPVWISNFVVTVDNLSSKGKIAWNKLTPKKCLDLLRKSS